MKCVKLRNQRPQAFWGALISSLIPAVVGGTSNIIAANKQAKAMKEQQEAQARLIKQQQQLANDSTNAASLNNYAKIMNDIETEDEYISKYKNGGVKKLRNTNPIKISDGGYAIPIDNNTYLLRGALHSNINESGKTGIGLQIGNKEVEAEGGEIVQQKGNNLRIFSNQPILNGISPAKQVLAGGNKDVIFNQQENTKRKYNLNNNQNSKLRTTAAFGARFTTPDYIGLGTNIGANLISGLWANSLYDNLLNSVKFTLPEYTEESFVASPVKWNDTGSKAAIIRNDINTRKLIGRNTASSNVARNSMQNISTNSMEDLMKLSDTKANKEMEMIQTNAAREQEVRSRNAQRRNEWSKNVADITNQQNALKTQIAQTKINSNLGMIQGINDSIGGFLQSGIDNYQNDQQMKMYLAASPYSTAYKLSTLGFKFNKPIIRSLVKYDEKHKDYWTSLLK